MTAARRRPSTPTRPQHFQGLTGAAVLHTSHFLLTRRALEDVVDCHAMGVIHGDAGLGKTLAAHAALAAHPDWAVTTTLNQPQAQHRLIKTYPLNTSSTSQHP
jgi:hypothetical protein